MNIVVISKHKPSFFLPINRNFVIQKWKLFLLMVTLFGNRTILRIGGVKKKK